MLGLTSRVTVSVSAVCSYPSDQVSVNGNPSPASVAVIVRGAPLQEVPLPLMFVTLGSVPLHGVTVALPLT